MADIPIRPETPFGPARVRRVFVLELLNGSRLIACGIRFVPKIVGLADGVDVCVVEEPGTGTVAVIPASDIRTCCYTVEGG